MSLLKRQRLRFPAGSSENLWLNQPSMMVIVEFPFKFLIGIRNEEKRLQSITRQRFHRRFVHVQAFHFLPYESYFRYRSIDYTHRQWIWATRRRRHRKWRHHWFHGPIFLERHLNFSYAHNLSKLIQLLLKYFPLRASYWEFGSLNKTVPDKTHRKQILEWEASFQAWFSDVRFDLSTCPRK